MNARDQKKVGGADQLPRVAYTMREVATMFGRSTNFVYDQVKAGRIRTIDDFGLKMVSAGEVARLAQLRPPSDREHALALG